MSGEVTIAIITAMGALFTALAGAVVVVFNAWHKNALERQGREASQKAEREKVALDEYKALVLRQDEQISRVTLHSEQQQEEITRMHRQYADCEVERMEQHGQIVVLHDGLCRALAALRRKGEDPGPDPAPPQKPRRPSPDADQARRTTEQNTRTLAAIDPRVPPADRPEP